MHKDGYHAFVYGDRLSSTEACKRRKYKTDYHRYRNNRNNHVFGMTSSEVKDTIGIYEMSSSEAKDTFGEDGTCFFIVSSAMEQRRTRVVASYIEQELPQYIVTTTFPVQSTSTVSSSDPCCNTLLKKNIHIETKDHSASSGVGSGESSELDSPNPPRAPGSEEKTCDKPVNKSTITDCTCKHRSKNTTKKKTSTRNSSSSSNGESRRDSGFSSMSSSSQLSPLRTIDESKVFHSPPLKKNMLPPLQVESKDLNKEILLMQIKKELYDEEKEFLVRHIKEILDKSGCKNFIDFVTLSNWKPLRKVPGKSLLKRPGTSLIEEIQNRRIAQSVQLTKRETQRLCTLKNCDIVRIIQQVRQCLKYSQLRTPLEYEFQVHQKIKLKQFPTYLIQKEEDNENKLKCTHLKTMASKGNVKKCLELMNKNHCVHSSSDCQQWPALHNALKKEHYRTAILLIEAGTNIKEYTERRVKEYNAMMDLVNNNKHFFKRKR